VVGNRALSCKVLIIPEDPTLNGFILRPLVRRILEECGKANAKVIVLSNPKVAGIDHARGLMLEIVESYAHFDLLLFLVDADGKDRSSRFSNLESEATKRGVSLICCAAQQEVEVWLLAGHVAKLDLPWNEVRADVSVKENVFAPFLRTYGDSHRAGGGRDLLMKETLNNYQGLLKRCPELAELRDRICRSLAATPNS
jgi:hypothetical protein